MKKLIGRMALIALSTSALIAHTSPANASQLKCSFEGKRLIASYSVTELTANSYRVVTAAVRGSTFMAFIRWSDSTPITDVKDIRNEGGQLVRQELTFSNGGRAVSTRPPREASGGFPGFSRSVYVGPNPGDLIVQMMGPDKTGMSGGILCTATVRIG